VNDALRAIGRLADELRARVVVEPITQFESRLCRCVPDALALCDAAGSPNVRVALDTHNMNITEADIGASIREAAGRIGHVHLADNNRRLPGYGHIDFGTVRAALRDASYDGWLSFECAVPGVFEDEIRRATQRLDHP
jgi:sugar phosphate isomerase/epimerase